MCKLASLLSMLLFAALVPIAAAKALHVNNSGSSACSDRTPYAANDSSRPWCTIGRAAWGNSTPTTPNPSQAAQPGDTVFISAGTYVEVSANPSCGRGSRFAVALNPANSGRIGAPITFAGVGNVNIRLAPGYAGPTIGAAAGRNHVVWDGVSIDETQAAGQSCPDTGPVVFHATVGSKLLNSTIRGTHNTWGDNYNGVRVEAASGIVVANNVIHGFTGNWSTNDAGIMLYDTADSTFENNRIYDSHTGIFVKGDHAEDGWPQQNNVFRFNWIENCSSIGITTIAGLGSRIYQNILKNNGHAFRIMGGGWQSADITVANNTVIAEGVGRDSFGYMARNTGGLTGIRVHNNIFFGSFAEAISMGEDTAIGDQSFEHNVYYGFRVFGSLNGSRITFAEWRGRYDKDNAKPPGLQADPLFVDNIIYKLRRDSPVITLAVDILGLNRNGGTAERIPAGAYVTGNEVIGPVPRLSGPSSPP